MAPNSDEYTQVARDVCERSGMLSRTRRWLFAGAGVLSVGLAVLGAILPGMPATVFLIIASYCFTRSCPWLEDRLLGHRIFAPYLPYVRQHAPMPRRARVVALLMMWGSVSMSLAALASAGRLAPWAAAAIVGAALTGTVAILRFRRAAVPREPAPASPSS
jgi:uncharacterized protein